MARRAVVLRKALALISDPSRWTQEAYARTRRGVATGADDGNAYQFCAAGAVLRVGPSDAARISLEKAAHILSERVGFPSISRFNDTRTHEDVLSLFDVAIAIQEIGE